MRSALLGLAAGAVTGANAQIPMPPTGMGMPGGAAPSAPGGAVPGMPAQMPPAGGMPRGIGVAPLSPGEECRCLYYLLSCNSFLISSF